MLGLSHGAPGLSHGVPGLSRVVPGLSHVVPGLSHGMPGLSHGVPGLSHVVPGLSHGVPGLSHGVPGLSHGVPGLSHVMPGLSHGVPGLSHGVPGLSDVEFHDFDLEKSLDPPLVKEGAHIMTLSTHAHIVSLSLPKPVPALIVRASTIVNAMGDNNATFVSPNPALAVARGHIDELITAQTAYQSRAGTLAARDNAQDTVIRDLHLLHAYVQQLANTSPDDAAVIAQDAAMTLRRAGATHKSDLATKQRVSGSVLVIAKAIAGARSYQWQYSLDGGTTWTAAAPTTRADVTIKGLPFAVRTLFRVRAVTKSGLTEWSQPVSLLVD